MFAYVKDTANIGNQRNVGIRHTSLPFAHRTLGTGENGAVITGSGWEGSNITLDGLTFYQNQVTDKNGGALNISGTNTISNSLFKANKTLKSANNCNGGGIYISGGVTTITNTSFESNDAQYRGEGIYVNSGTLNLTDVTFTGQSGYDLWLTASSTAVLTNVTFGAQAYFKSSNATLNGNVTFNGGVAYYAPVTVNGNIVFALALAHCPEV